MIEFKKTSATLNENYDYSDDSVMGTVNVHSDPETNAIVSMNGQVYEKTKEGTQGAYIGNFNGQMQNGVMKYTTSQMTREQNNIVMDLVEELEQELIK